MYRLNQEERYRQMTREALEDVDAGRTISHQAVQAWAESLASGSPQPIPIVEEE